MGKEILRDLPDDDFDFDGEEEENESFNEMVEDWRFEMQTYYY